MKKYPSKKKLIELVSATEYQIAMDDTQNFIQSAIESGYSAIEGWTIKELKKYYDEYLRNE